MAACFDVAVVGGGPAGAFAAHELARAGVNIVLIDPATSRPRLEGLGERVAYLLKQKGLEGALQAASTPMPRSVRWAGLNETTNGERLVRRHDFDEILRIGAIKAGANYLKARVSRIDKLDANAGVVLNLSTGDSVTTRLMIDARGRQAHSPNRQKGPQTLAVAGLLSTAVDRVGTHVEATPEGWIWSAADPEFGHWIQICIDASDLPGSGHAALSDRMRAFLAQPQFQSRFDGCDFQGALLARHAGLVLSAPTLPLPILPIGDAAVAIDPLSGHGMFWALSSALASVPSVLTLLDDPEAGPDLASQFYRDRVVSTFWRQARIGRDFYRLENDLVAHPFWAARSAWPDNQPAHAEAHEFRMKRRVVVDGNRLTEREVLITPRDPDGVAFVSGIPVRELVDFSQPIPAARPLTDRSAASGLSDASPASADALRWLQSRGLLSASQLQFINTHTKMRETA